MVFFVPTHLENHPLMPDIRESKIAEGVYADQLGMVYYKDRQGNYVGYRPFTTKRGYQSINISRKGKNCCIFVHRAVASAFHGESPEGHQCAHLNGNARDNRADNLTWVTPRENNSHKKTHGTTARGERQGASKLTEVQVRDIRAKYEAGDTTLRRLAVEFNVSNTNISNIVLR